MFSTGAGSLERTMAMSAEGIYPKGSKMAETFRLRIYIILNCPDDDVDDDDDDDVDVKGGEAE